MKAIPDPNSDSPRGLAFAIGAYVLWGFLPIYMKSLAALGPFEIIAHRIIWSLPVAAVVLLWQHRSAEVLTALRTPRLLAMAALTACLITANWLIYVWAVINDRAIEAALGYYINPLFSIFLGAVLLGERLNRMQKLAVALAALAVIILTLDAGKLPLVAIGLTFSWGIYAYCKKSLPLGPNQGFTLEVLMLTPLALGYVIWLQASGQGHFTESSTTMLLLLGCGPVTAIPLMLYANGAKLVRLSTIGVLQYIAPTMIFLTAVFVFGEPFGGAQLIAFPLIWMALIIYSITLIREAGRRRKSRRDLASHRAQ
ncbi:EamA family transporter RarD [Paracoccus tegillarcae]|uniref:EamA family transporter RarD n=1 Tax=Paracoccus tegillarcae TaxID=1529068 RepID=A0A2K9EMC5_9RHOB|nr:EamA family transporter RarD [Paracoccus tegillarcae]AUH32755.1 EamA family transporter RarD [Paracoccus tegillarcae]